MSVCASFDVNFDHFRSRARAFCPVICGRPSLSLSLSVLLLTFVPLIFLFSSTKLRHFSFLHLFIYSSSPVLVLVVADFSTSPFYRRWPWAVPQCPMSASAIAAAAAHFFLFAVCYPRYYLFVWLSPSLLISPDCFSSFSVSSAGGGGGGEISWPLCLSLSLPAHTEITVAFCWFSRE